MIISGSDTGFQDRIFLSFLSEKIYLQILVLTHIYTTHCHNCKYLNFLYIITMDPLVNNLFLHEFIIIKLLKGAMDKSNETTQYAWMYKYLKFSSINNVKYR